jgi:hypothetical protein
MLTATAKAQAVRELVASIRDDIIDAIEQSGARGVPDGHIYAALMGAVNLDTYRALTKSALGTGRVVKRGDVFFPAGKI